MVFESAPLFPEDVFALAFVVPPAEAAAAAAALPSLVSLYNRSLLPVGRAVPHLWQHGFLAQHHSQSPSGPLLHTGHFHSLGAIFFRPRSPTLFALAALGGISRPEELPW